MRELWPSLSLIEEHTQTVPALRPVVATKWEEDGAEVTIPAMPDFVAKELDRHLAAKPQVEGQLNPGFIVLVESRLDDKGRVTQNLQHPFAFCLNRRLADDKTNERWEGWITAPEVDYAGNFDVLLEPDDGPFNPLAGMVQTWNVVRLRIDRKAGVLAKLSVNRLAIVRAVAEEVISGAPLTDSAQPGVIALRITAKGKSVLTGSPLGKFEDPRHIYQKFYRQLAKSFLPKAANDSRAFVSKRPMLYALAASAVASIAVLFATMQNTAQPDLVAMNPPPVVIKHDPITLPKTDSVTEPAPGNVLELPAPKVTTPERIELANDVSAQSNPKIPTGTVPPDMAAASVITGTKLPPKTADVSSPNIGTATILNKQGHILASAVIVGTNTKCRYMSTTENTSGVATVLRINKDLDLAILTADKTFMNPAKIEFIDAKGGMALSLGYPLPTRVQSFSNGNIKSSVKISNKIGWFKHDGVLKPGMTGSPVFNEYGFVVGFNVTNVSNDLVTIDKGSDPHEGALAIKSSKIREWLDELSIPYAIVKSLELNSKTVDSIVDDVENSVLSIDCRK
jgi:hypothetical protein